MLRLPFDGETSLDGVSFYRAMYRDTTRGSLRVAYGRDLILSKFPNIQIEKWKEHEEPSNKFFFFFFFYVGIVLPQCIEILRMDI